MGEKGAKGRGSKTAWSGRLLTAGGTGFALAVAALMVLPPVSAGAGVHPAVVLKAPYKGTVATPNWYASVSGCGAAKSVVGKWVPTTGVVTGSDVASGKFCGKHAIGYAGAYSSGYASSGVEIGLPFKVLTTANHSIGSSWTLTIASSGAFAHTTCPAKNLKWPPAYYSYEYASCSAGFSLSIYINTQLIDLSNSSWYHYNYSYVDSYNSTGWQNYSDCYNYGTPTCYNSTGTGNYSYANAYSYNAPGASSFKWNGATTFTMWTNSTMPMPKGDKWAIVMSLYLDVGGSAGAQNVLGPFAGSGSASLNMATLGNGAKLNSVTIV